MRDPELALKALGEIEQNADKYTNATVLHLLFTLAEDQEISISFEYHSGWVQTRGDGEWNEPEMSEDRRGYEVMVSMYGYEDQPYNSFDRAVSVCFNLFKSVATEALADKCAS